MQLQAKFIDDFKSERKDISPPLQPILRLVPVLLYLLIAASILLNALFIAQFSQAGRLKETALKEARETDAELEATKSERQRLEDEAKKASDLAAWVDTSRPLQPLVVEIARSMAPESSLLELRLDRDKDNPSQIRLSMKLLSDDSGQLDRTLQTIVDSRFRSFSPEQSVVQGEVDYRATLLWQDGNRVEEPIQ